MVTLAVRPVVGYIRKENLKMTTTLDGTVFIDSDIFARIQKVTVNKTVVVHLIITIIFSDKGFGLERHLDCQLCQ